MDTVPLSTRRQLELMQQLQELADERAQGERTIHQTREAELDAAQQERLTRTDSLVKDCTQRRRDLENEYSEAKRAANQRLRDVTDERQSHWRKRCKRIEDNSKQVVLAIERRKKESEWQALAVFDAGKDLPGQALAEATHRLQARLGQIDGLERDANTLMEMRRLTRQAQTLETPVGEPPQDESEIPQDPEAQLQTAINDAHRAVLGLQSQRLPALMLEGWRWVGWWALASLLIAPGALLLGIRWWSPLAAIVGGGALVAILFATLGGRVRRLSLGQYAVVTKLLQCARHREQAARLQAETRCQQETEAVVSFKDQELLAAETLRDSALAELENKKKTELDEAQHELDAAQETAQNECATAQASAEGNLSAPARQVGPPAGRRSAGNRREASATDPSGPADIRGRVECHGRAVAHRLRRRRRRTGPNARGLPSLFSQLVHRPSGTSGNVPINRRRRCNLGATGCHCRR